MSTGTHLFWNGCDSFDQELIVILRDPACVRVLNELESSKDDTNLLLFALSLAKRNSLQ